MDFNSISLYMPKIAINTPCLFTDSNNAIFWAWRYTWRNKPMSILHCVSKNSHDYVFGNNLNSIASDDNNMWYSYYSDYRSTSTVSRQPGSRRSHSARSDLNRITFYWVNRTSPKCTDRHTESHVKLACVTQTWDDSQFVQINRCLILLIDKNLLTAKSMNFQVQQFPKVRQLPKSR